MHTIKQCAAQCKTAYTERPLCSVCRESLAAPYGMSFARYSEIARMMTKQVLKPATPNGVKGTMRAAHKNATYPYMRVRDRVGMNSATPVDLLAVCRSHATPNRDGVDRGFITPLGWE
jgi:hypothetical protein